MQTLRPDLKLFIHPVKCCTPFAATGRDDRLFRFGGYDQRHEVTDYFEVFVPDIHRKIPDVYPNSDRTVAEDLDTGLAAYHALTVSYPHSPYGLG